MLGKLSGQHLLCDGWIIEELLPKYHLLVQIDQMIDFSFVEEETKDLYSSDTGRPSYPPEQLFRMLVIAFLYNLSDVQVASQVRYNLLYRVFCRFSLLSQAPDDSTLVVFRTRLGEERFERLLDRFVEQARERGLLLGQRKLVDASIIRANAALKNRAELLRAGRKRVLREVARSNPELAKTLSELTKAVDTPGLSPEEVVAKEEERRDAFLKALAGVGDESVRFWGEELRKVRDGEGGVASFADPDCRWGYKKKGEPFLGYKVHASCDESGIITSVEVLPGNASEGERLPELLRKDREKGVMAKSVVGDKAYDSAANRKVIRQEGMDPEIPSRNRDTQAYRFRYHPEEDTFTCPEGKETIGKSPHQRGGDLYYFSEADCRRCDRRDACLSPYETRKRVYLSERAREALTSHKDLREALKARKEIERKFGQAKQWHGMQRARYRERWRVAIQVFMTFIVMSLKQMVRLVLGREG